MMDRRVFLKLAGFGSLAVATGAVASPLSSSRFNRELVHVNKTRLMMGTFVNISLFHESRTLGEEAVETAFDLIHGKEEILTRFSDASPVGSLNREGRLRELSPEVNEAVQLSRRFFRETGGCFDITVKPVIDVTRDAFSLLGKPPDEQDLMGCLDRVGMEHMAVSAGEIRFRREGMGITLDGIAKGLIVDWSADRLIAKGVEHFLINAGGDIRVAGGKQDGSPWRIAVRDPERRDQFAAVIRLREGAVATSGNYEIYFDQEKLFHHIVDPSTGRSPVTGASVSTVASTAAEADALSTAVFVMEPHQGRGFLEKRPGIEGLIITSSHRKFSTSGWRALEA